MTNNVKYDQIPISTHINASKMILKKARRNIGEFTSRT